MKKQVLVFFLLWVLLISGCRQETGETWDLLEWETESQTEIPTVILLSHAESANSTTQEMALRFQAALLEESSGSLYVDVYPNNTLGDYEENRAAMMNGSIQIRVGNCHSEIISVLCWPDLCGRSITEIDEMLKGGWLVEMLEEELLDKGLRYLGCSPLSTFVLTSCDKISVPEDLQQLHVRIAGSDSMKAFWTSLGAKTMSYSADQAYAVLQQGFADANGQNPINIIVSRRLYEYQKYLTKTNHVIYFEPIYISELFWNSLHEEERLWIRNALEKTLKEEEMLALQREESNEQFLMEQGIIIQEQPDWWKEFVRENAVTDVRKTLEQEFGAERLEELLEILQSN